MATEALAIGRVLGAHGIRGELRILLYNEDSTLPTELERVQLRNPAGKTVDYEVAGARPGSRGWLLRLVGLDDRTAAELLTGHELVVDREQLPALGEDEFYYHQLIGMKAATVEGRELGVIEEIFDNGASDILVIRSDGHEVLVPFIDEVVVKVDLEGNTVLLDPPDGLLD